MEIPAALQFAYGACVGQKQQNKNATCNDTPPTALPVERTTMLIECKSGAKQDVASSESSSSDEKSACSLGDAKVEWEAVTHAISAKGDCPSGSHDDSKMSSDAFPTSRDSNCKIQEDEVLAGGCKRSRAWSCTLENGDRETVVLSYEQSGTKIVGTGGMLHTWTSGDDEGKTCEVRFTIEGKVR
jgi:hypothetical protein